MAVVKQQIVLASSSIYRRDLLRKLVVEFSRYSPDIDETPLPDELPEAMVRRLATLKAQAVTEKYSNALVIASDQAAVVDGQVLGKPGNYENALEQLLLVSGKSVVFHTSLCLLNSATGHMQTAVEPFTVHFRSLTTDQIGNYLRRDKPYDCAGAFKSEGFGVVLFEKMEGDDPNALVGLPLIRLRQMFEREGIYLV